MSNRVPFLCIAICLIAPGALAAASCDTAAAPQVPVIKGLDYDHARATLLAAGWQPGHGSQFTDMAGNQAAFHDRGYTELQSCSLDASNACYFNFNASGNIMLRVTTEGEENPLLDTKAVVRSAELGCQQ